MVDESEKVTCTLAGIRWAHRFAWVAAVATLLLVALGGLVTSHDAGMVFPDWPTSNGELVNPDGWLQSGKMRLEHGHRLLGWLVGMSAISLVVMAHRQSNGLFRWLSLAALAAIVAQGIMGGLRVTEISTAWAVVHGIWGQVCFSLMVCNAVVTGAHGAGAAIQASHRANAIRGWLVITTLALIGQLATGALTRHIASGFAFHFCGAMLVTILIARVILLLDSEIQAIPWARTWLLRLVVLLGLQLTLGMVTYLVTGGSSSRVTSPTPAEWMIPTFHVVVGACLLACCAALLTLVFRLLEVPQQCRPLPSSLPASTP